MKTLEKKEWIAVVVAIFVVGYVFIFGSGLMKMVSGQSAAAAATTVPQTQVLTKDVVVGNGEEALADSVVVINYVGHFVNGTVFDSSVARNEPVKFILNSGQVIKGWDMGIVGMKVGGTRLIAVPPELGFGPNDYDSIPGGSTLVYEIELLKVGN